MNRTHPAGNSRPVRTAQLTAHPGLFSRIDRHLHSEWRQPLHAGSVAAFERATELAGDDVACLPVIFDSGCGTGQGTRYFAQSHPDHLVFGVDRSGHRLSKAGWTAPARRNGNIIWVQAELGTFWRLAEMHGWQPSRHYLFYPNPYPKSSQLGRRWHAHPVFPVLMRLGGRLELRTNWLIYAREFCQALKHAAGIDATVQRLRLEAPVTAFERKYRDSGHALYCIRADLDATDS